MDYQDYVNNSPTQMFLATALIIYLTFRAIHWANKRFVSNISNRNKLQKTLYFLEFVAWILYVFEAIKYFYKANIIIAITLSIILIIITAWTTWYVIKDYVAGLYIKWNNLYSINDEIEIEQQKGKIIAMKSRSAIIEIDALHTSQIVYSKFFAKNVIKIGLSGLSSNISFTIKLPVKLNPVETIEKITTYIYQLPWINIKHKPIVIIEKQDAQQTLIRINASLIDVDYSEEFKNNIKTKFE